MVDFAYKRKIVFYRNKIKWLEKQVEEKPKDWMLIHELNSYKESLKELISLRYIMSYPILRLMDKLEKFLSSKQFFNKTCGY
jgi:hypothetical protein